MRPLVLRNREFATLWISQSVNQAGHRMFQIAVMWWIISHATDAPGQAIAIFMFLGALPPLLFANRIGRAIDVLPVRRLLVSAPLGAALVALLLALILLLGEEAPIWLYPASFLFATALAVIEPAVMKAIPELVPDEDVLPAVAFISSTQTLAFFAGAMAGALLIESIGLVGNILLMAAASALTAFANGTLPEAATPGSTAAPVETPPASPPAAAPPAMSATSDGTAETSLGGEIASASSTSPATPAPDPAAAPASAWSVVRSMPVMFRVLLGFTAINFFSVPVLVLMPIYTKTILGGGAPLLGLYEAALWTGLLVGSIIGRYISERRDPLRVAAVCLVFFGTCLGLPGLFVHQVLYGIFLFGTGAALGTVNVRMLAYFQKAVEPSVRGRFFSAMRATVSGAVPIGFMVFGTLADRVSIATLTLSQGAAILALSGYFFLLARQTTGSPDSR
jgi:predicted MFS family arabinose efflux permease